MSDEMIERQRELDAYRIIKSDIDTIYNLFLNISSSANSSILLLGIMPFLAIVIRGFEDFTGDKILDNKTDVYIYDIRNSIKILTDKYRKVQSVTKKSDAQQDEEFRAKLRLGFLQKINIHNNLGIYLTLDGHIISNTQWINYSLGLSDIPENSRPAKSFELGNLLGKAICQIEQMFSKVLPMEFPSINPFPDIGYIDINTNRNNRFFLGTWTKEESLVFLHLLSIVNFEKYFIESLLPKDNTFVFRIKYIVLHHVIHGIENMYRHLNPDGKLDRRISDEMTDIFSDKTSIFPSAFRGCMMHYGLMYKGESVINQDLYDPNKEFFGLIESCFGMSFDDYNKKIDHKIDVVIRFLEKQFDVKTYTIKTDW